MSARHQHTFLWLLGSFEQGIVVCNWYDIIFVAMEIEHWAGLCTTDVLGRINFVENFLDRNWVDFLTSTELLGAFDL